MPIRSGWNTTKTACWPRCCTISLLSWWLCRSASYFLFLKKKRLLGLFLDIFYVHRFRNRNCEKPHADFWGGVIWAWLTAWKFINCWTSWISSYVSFSRAALKNPVEDFISQINWGWRADSLISFKNPFLKLFSWVLENLHIDPENTLFLGWDELGLLGLRGISPTLNTTTSNSETSMLHFFSGYPKHISKLFDRALLEWHTQKSFFQDKNPERLHGTLLEFGNGQKLVQPI